MTALWKGNIGDCDYITPNKPYEVVRVNVDGSIVIVDDYGMEVTMLATEFWINW